MLHLTGHFFGISDIFQVLCTQWYVHIGYVDTLRSQRIKLHRPEDTLTAQRINHIGLVEPLAIQCIKLH